MKRNRGRLVVFLFVVGVMASGGVLLNSFKDPNPDESPVEVVEGRLQYKWYPPRIPSNISFAGERVPLERWEVKERLEREVLINYYMHGSFLYILKLHTRYFPIIEQRLKANGVPDDFKYLCVAESSLQHLTSPAGAQSLWQFLSGTASAYGLEVNSEVDERYHVAKATDAACRYLQQAKDKFGSWTAAAASYNCGMGGYNSQASFQGSNNYYDLLLPEETNRYIFRILAFKYLMSAAKQFGYIVEGQDAYKPFKTRSISVSSSIPNLATWALDNGTSYKLLKLTNPWLRSKSLTVKPGKVYQIEIPVGQ